MSGLLSRTSMPEEWMVVRRAPSIPGGYRVVQSGLWEDQAKDRAARYSRPHEAMSTRELMNRRRAALQKIEEGNTDG